MPFLCANCTNLLLNLSRAVTFVQFHNGIFTKKNAPILGEINPPTPFLPFCQVTWSRDMFNPFSDFVTYCKTSLIQCIWLQLFYLIISLNFILFHSSTTSTQTEQQDRLKLTLGKALQKQLQTMITYTRSIICMWLTQKYPLLPPLVHCPQMAWGCMYACACV